MKAGLVIAAIALAAVSGVPGLFVPAGRRLGERLAAALLLVGSALALFASVDTLVRGDVSAVEVPWTIPGASLSVRLDALAAFFLVPIFLGSALGSLYGLEYWPDASYPGSGRRLRVAWGLIIAGLGTVAIAADGVLFLFGWEVMALAAFVAVGAEDHLEPTRRASYLYLVTTRVGTLCLFAMFVLLRADTGSFALRALPAHAPHATAIFLLGVAGFGLKAGVMPAHVWLPPAHAAAPSHVSAMMSGVLIKIGIYGLLRLLSLLPVTPLWWGLLLVAAGAVSAVLGVAFAIGQHDLKRLLAYHSVENIGIIVLGLGAAVVGRSAGRAELVVLGLGGALLHVWNHGLFKGLLFLSAGAVVHATGTRQMDRLGGLLRAMPRTGALFLLAALAICGLPPLNGFVSELFVYLGLFDATRLNDRQVLYAAFLSMGALALVGGLALACFTKVFGGVFLGAARSPDAARAHDGGALMTGPMVVLALGCALIGLAPVLVVTPLDHAVAAFLDGPAPSVASLAPLSQLSVMGAVLLGVSASIGLVLWRRLAAAPVSAAPTWDCGYAAPTARMQYTTSSFGDFLVGLFAWALRPVSHLVGARRAHPEEHADPLGALVPAPSRFSSHVDDTFLERLYAPALARVASALKRLGWLQPGRLHLYVLYVVVTLVALLWWAQGAR